jgi:uncharacterized protein (DUF305 family)
MFLLLAVALGAQQGEGRMGPESPGMMDDERMLGMSRSMPGTPIRSEQDFILEMIPHHMEAADAAMLIYASTRDPALKELAGNIYEEQLEEVKSIKLFYAQKYQRVPSGRQSMPMMRDLNVLSGEAQDVQFAEDMIPHHMSAIAMAQQALRLPGLSEEIRQFAEKVVNDQGREIEFMKRWLAERGR